jgi:hypothetical protein
MRRAVGVMLVTLSACAADGSPESTDPAKTNGGAGTPGSPSGSGSPGPAGAPGSPGAAGSPSLRGGAVIALPHVYPPVREATPTALIADATYASPAEVAASTRFGAARQALGEINLATAIQERFYSQGPTNLLRIVKQLDDRVSALDMNPALHPCLNAAPHALTYALPGGQTFEVRLQCVQQFAGPGGGSGNWLAFGFDDRAAAGGASVLADAGLADAGPADATASAAEAEGTAADAGVRNDFYLIEGQPGGNGGAYRIDASGNVEGWLAVAERDIPGNSQVIMHLRTHKSAGTLELALGGAAVGFCSAHLKTNATFLFVNGKTNAPPPPGTMQEVGTQYCDVARSGCFQAEALGTDLGSDSSSCAALAPSTFELAVGLDASSDPDANVVIGNIYTYFSEMPSGVPAF